MQHFLLCALLLILVSTELSAGRNTVEHQLSFEQRKNQYVTVRLNLPVQSETTHLAMPNWTPGSYLIRDYAAQVEGLKAYGGSGKELEVSKIEKHRWRIATAGEESIEVRYQVWAGELAVNAGWVEDEFAMLNGAGVFLYNESTRKMPQSLKVDLPDAWQNAHVALPGQGEGLAYIAKDYDELVDSPILLGNTTTYPFDLDGQKYALINQGDSRLWDGEKAAADALRIVKSVQSFWQINPLEREYLFMNIIANFIGGLEHDYSTVMLSSPWQMRSREDYVRWLSLVTHEFFHVWNVRRLRPQALSEYQYDREIYTGELWLAEGLSSYYDNLLLFRSGIITVDEYMQLLADEILSYELSPGRKVQSAEEASFDTWIKHYKPDANSINSDVSYYRKGSLIGFVADASIREASKQESSLDDVMRDMYRLYGPAGSSSRGYPPRAFETLVEQRAGLQVRQEIENMITTIADPDVDAALDYYGLRLERAPSRKAAESAGNPVPADFGLVWTGQESLLIVESVVRGGSGSLAGVLPGDELLAVNDQRVNRLNILDRMLRLQPGESADLLLVRNGRVLTLPAQVQHAIPEKYRIEIKPDINKRQKERMQQWLGLQLEFRRN